MVKWDFLKKPNANALSQLKSEDSLLESSTYILSTSILKCNLVSRFFLSIY